MTSVNTVTVEKHSKAYIINSGLIFTFFAILFTFQKNFYFTATILLITSLFFIPKYFKSILATPTAFPTWLLVTSLLLFLDLNTRDKGGEYLIERPIFLLSLIPIYYNISKLGFNIKALIFGLIIATIYGGLYGYYLAEIKGLGRAWGTSLNPILFGNLGAFLLVFTLSRFFYLISVATRSKMELLVTAISIMCALLIVWSSGSRGPILTLALLTAVFTVYFKLYKSWKFYTTALVISISAMGYYYSFPNHLINQRLTSAAIQVLNENENVDNSTTLRLAMWATSVEMAKDNLIFGSGYVKHEALYLEAIENLGMENVGISHFKQHHSDFFNLLAYYGLTGLFIYISLLSLLIITYINSRNLLTFDLQTLFLGHIVCFIGVGLTDASVLKINGSAILMVPATIFLGYINYKKSIQPT